MARAGAGPAPAGRWRFVSHVIEQSAAATRGLGRDSSSRLWPNNSVGQFVGNGDVIQRRFDVLAQLPSLLDRPLQLMEERDGQNQIQIFGMVAAHQQPVVGIRQQRLERIDHLHRLEQPLERMMPTQHRFALPPRRQPSSVWLWRCASKMARVCSGDSSTLMKINRLRVSASVCGLVVV